MVLLNLSQAYTLLDAVPATSDTESDAVATPVRCTTISWQTIFGTPPGDVEMQLLGSLNGVDFFEIDVSTEAAGELRTIETNVTHIKARIDTITDGADVSFIVVCKDL